MPSDNCLVELRKVGGREVRGAITNDFIAVTLDGGLRVPFRGSRAGEIRGMTGRIPLFAWEEAFPLEKIRDTRRRRSGTYLARTHQPRGRPPDVSIFNRPHDTLRGSMCSAQERFEIGERIESRLGIEIFLYPDFISSNVYLETVSPPRASRRSDYFYAIVIPLVKFTFKPSDKNESD